MIYISEKTLETIMRSLGSKEYETGGLIGSSSNDIIDTFFYDEGRGESRTDFYPYVELWQKQLAAWEEKKIVFCGIIHSHLKNDSLSDRDVEMAREIIQINDLRSILMPIYVINRQEIIWYEVGRENIRILVCKTVNNMTIQETLL